MVLSEREAHCVARFIQGALFGKEELDGCIYCKYQCYRDDNQNRRNELTNVRYRLMKETGVDLSFATGKKLESSAFPYHKFLQNANEGAKEHFRTFFSDI